MPVWGRGLGREGVGAVVDRLFRSTTVPVVKAEVDDRNERSLRLLDALGFRAVGRVLGADRFKGADSNEVHLELVRNAWLRLVARGQP